MFEEIKKAQVEQKFRTLVATGVVMNPQQFAKSFTKDELSVMDQDMIEKAMNHKYFKREGTPGNYKYYYTEAEYKQAKGERGKEFKYGEINQEDLDVNDKVYVDTYNDYLHGEKKPNNKQHEDASHGGEKAKKFLDEVGEKEEESLEEGFSNRDFEKFVIANESNIKSNMETYGFKKKDLGKITNYYDFANILGVDTSAVKDIDHQYYGSTLKELLY